MNRINPLYLALLLVAILLFSSYKLSSAKDDLAQANEAYKESSNLGKELSGLKKAYTTKLNLSNFKSASLLKKESKTGVKISAKSMDIKTLNALMSKVLNGAYNITSLEIKRVSETKVSLNMEIKW